jgi:hypothetical protein
MAGEAGAFIECAGGRERLLPGQGLWIARGRHALVVLERRRRSTIVEDRPQRAALPAQSGPAVQRRAIRLDEEAILERHLRVGTGVGPFDPGRLGPGTRVHRRKQQDGADLREEMHAGAGPRSFHGEQDGSGGGTRT